jgi:DNA repair photolyase
MIPSIRLQPCTYASRESTSVLTGHDTSTLLAQEGEVIRTEHPATRAGVGTRRESSRLPYALAVRERRVLVPIGRRCPFGCRYCYADDVTTPSDKSLDVTHILAAIARLDSRSFDIIQLGYDGDPLASSGSLRLMLPVLADTGKHINISTKGLASMRLREFLGSVHKQTAMGISLNVSATCWESAPEIEPKTPTPYRRLKSASLLASEQSVPFVLSLRPLIPTIADNELHRLLDCAREMGAMAAVTGPLYAHPDGSNMTWSNQTYEEVEPTEVAWSPVPLRYRRIEDAQRVSKLKLYSESIGLQFYPKNAPALKQLVEKARA